MTCGARMQQQRPHAINDFQAHSARLQLPVLVLRTPPCKHALGETTRGKVTQSLLLSGCLPMRNLLPKRLLEHKGFLAFWSSGGSRKDAIMPRPALGDASSCFKEV